MALLINLYDTLTEQNGGVPPSTTGTWTYTGTTATGVPPAPPAAPAAYNLDVDFAGVTAAVDDYQYTYTVTSGTCSTEAVVNVNLYEHFPVSNDTCATPRTIVFPYNGGTATHTEQFLGTACPGQAHPTYSGTANATAWGTLTFAGDLWYVVNYDASYPTTQPIVMDITVDGTPYGTGGITNPFIAVYSACTPVEVTSDVPINGSQEATIVIDSVFTTDFTYYIRVACQDGDQGKFDISITV